MKTISTTLLTLAAVFAVGVAAAQDSKVPAAMPAGHAMCCMDSMHRWARMDEHMKRMQALHEQMASATTPEERQRLMSDQRREMQHGMAMMQAKPHDGSRMGGAGAGAMGQKADLRPEDSDADDGEAHGHDADDDAGDDGPARRFR